MTLSDDEDSQIEITKLRLANKEAAEYGLTLLHEKNQLKSQHEELENQYELLQIELKQLKNELEICQNNQREEIVKGEINEANLLNEKKIREEYLIKEINHYKNELRLLKQTNERLDNENKNILFDFQQLNKQIQEFDELKIKLKYDLKESKTQEQRLIDIRTELEEDNLILQQQVERLTKNLLDFDGLKIENQQLQENIDDLHRMNKELQSLKTIAESQLIELHNHLRDERKEKHLYKQQLDNQIQKESLCYLKSLRMTLNGPNSNYDYLNSGEDDGIEDHDDANRVASSIDYSEMLENDQQSTGSLFSEIHDNVIPKLELECLQLSQNKSSLDNQLLTIHNNTKILSYKIQHMTEKISSNQNSSNETNSNDTNNLLITSIEQIDSIINKNLHLFNGDYERLKKKSDEQEFTIVKLKQDLNIMMKQSNDIQTMFIQIHDTLINFSEELEILHPFETKDRRLTNSNTTIFDPTMNDYILSILYEQIKQIKQLFDKPFPTNDANELQDQIIKLRTLLTTKQEQISTLRQLLKETKHTAEIALANLKSAYENEKSILTETISKLRDEVKSFKEDAAIYVSMHSMFAARCDEYMTKLHQSQRQVQAAEEEKKTLNALLHLAVKQKISLTQIIEDLEIMTEVSTDSPNPLRRTNHSELPPELLTIASNKNSMSEKRKGRFIPPRMIQALTKNKNQR